MDTTVIRVLYLPRETDNRLRQIAFDRRVSMNDLVCTFLAHTLERSFDKRLLEQLDQLDQHEMNEA